MSIKILKLNLIILLNLVTIPLLNGEELERPNIIFIMVDDLGWSDIGCYGSEIKTPNIDSLAENGVRFRQFHNYSKCTVSRASLLTGLYASQAGFKDGVHYLKNSVTVGEVLRSSGYHTYASGKHHGYDNLYDRGFDRYYGLRDGACNHFNPGLQRNGEPAPGRKGSDREWCDDSLLFDTRDPNYQSYFPTDFYSTDAFTDKAIEYVDEWSKEDSGRPFFLYLAYTAPHDPLMAWPDDIAKYEGVYDAGFDAIRNARYQKQQDIGLLTTTTHPLSAPTYNNWDNFSAAKKESEANRMEVHAAMVDRVDQKIGDLIIKLKAEGAFDNTLILFCSDNGAQNGNLSYGDSSLTIGGVGWYTSLGTNWNNVCNTPYRYDKESLYNGGARTPMIIHWPDGIVNPGRYTDKVGHLMDFMATALELTGAEYPRKQSDGEPVIPLEGESFVDVLNDDPVQPRENQLFTKWSTDRSLMDGYYKIISQNNGSSWSLYNLNNEATEITNISSSNSVYFDNLINDYSDWYSRVYTNTFPSVNDDAAEFQSGVLATVDVLANDYDGNGSIDGSTLSISRPPLYGSATINSDYTISYSHNGGDITYDEIYYQVKDNDGALSNEALLSLSLNNFQGENYSIEAEDTTFYQANIQSNQPSASGGSHINYSSSGPAGYIEWSVDINTPGAYELDLFYFLGSSERVLNLTVNGSLVEENIIFPTTGSWSVSQKLELVAFNLNAGVNTIRLSTEVNTDGPNMDYLELKQVQVNNFQGESYRIEAEDTTICSANIQSNRPSTSGGSHVNYLANNPAGYIEWSVYINTPGSYELDLVYLLGNSERTLNLTVNGSLVEADIIFPTTGSWSVSQKLEVAAFNLNAGVNTIRLSTKSNTDGPNMDYLELNQIPTVE